MQFRRRKFITGILFVSSMTISPAARIFTQPDPAISAPPPALPYVALSVSVAGAVAGIINLIKGLQNNNEKKKEFTQRLVGRLREMHPDYNVVVAHEVGKVEGDDYFHDHVELDLDVIGTFGYEVFMSPEGKFFKFERKGDGGPINWGFAGTLERKEDDRVITDNGH